MYFGCNDRVEDGISNIMAAGVYFVLVLLGLYMRSGYVSMR
jgi:hypothetical protein